MESSSLALLPRELRDIIYQYTFTSPYAVTLQPGHIQHPLTKTCSQLRRETIILYYSLTRFNAHLDDGPATPLVNWLLNTSNNELIFRVEEINIWDMHMLKATLHGFDSTVRLLASSTEKSRYTLKFLRGDQIVEDVRMALVGLGLDLVRFCIKHTDFGEELTSEFAIVHSGWQGIQEALQAGREAEKRKRARESKEVRVLGYVQV